MFEPGDLVVFKYRKLYPGLFIKYTDDEKQTIKIIGFLESEYSKNPYYFDLYTDIFRGIDFV